MTVKFWTSICAAAVSVGLITGAELKENLALAREGNRFTSQSIRFCVTNPARNLGTMPIEAINEGIEHLRGVYNESDSSFSTAVEVGRKSLKYSIGNCQELSCVGWIYLLAQKKFNKKIDIYMIKNTDAHFTTGGDHMFIVIGRQVGSDPKKPGTWGEHAVIWDPLKNQFFPATQLDKLEDYLGLDTNDRPLFRCFSPLHQELKLWVSNLLTAEDFSYLAGPISMWEERRQLGVIQSLLSEFYLTRAVEKGKALIDFLTHSPVKHISAQFLAARLTLIEQIEYLIHTSS